MPTWCIPGPRLARKRPTYVSSPSGATSSIPTGPEPQVHRLDALLLEPAAHLDFGAEERAVRLDRRVEVLDGEGDVVHRAHVHVTDPNDWPSGQTARGVPTRSDALDSGSTLPSKASSSRRFSVSFSSSSAVMRSRVLRCFEMSLTVSP